MHKMIVTIEDLELEPLPARGRSWWWHCRHCAAAVFLGVCVALGGSPVRAGAVVQSGWDEGGLSSLAYEGVALLADATPELIRVVTADGYRDRRQETHEEWYAGETRSFAAADTTVIERSFDRETKTVALRYAWGRVIVRYQPREDGLDIRAGIENTSEQVIEHIKLRLMALRFPDAVSVGHVHSVPGFGYSKVNLGGPTVVRARSGDLQALWVSLQPNRPMKQNFAPLGQPNTRAVMAEAGHPTGGAEIYDGVWDARPIAPGERDVWELSLRLAPAHVSSYERVSDVFTRFGEAHPMTLDWPDRRPIPMIHVADGGGTEQNPRGWGHAIPLPADWDIADEDSHETFREAALRGARNIVNVSRQMGAQGVIVWQIEGMEHYQHTYYGDPQILPYVAPEMDAVADEFFAVLRDAGLRHGVTLRPSYHFPVIGEHDRCAAPAADDWGQMEKLGQSISAGHRDIPESSAHLYSKESAWCMVSRLDDKIRYARERWGSTLFYVDDNSIWRPRDARAAGQGWSGKLIPAEVFEELHRRHPDILLIPEHQYFQYYASTAPYGETPRTTVFSQETTGPDVRAAYPEAFGVQQLHRVANEVRDNLDHYIQAIAAGDVHLPHGWFSDFARMRSMYHPAAALAPIQIAIDTDGIFLANERFASVDALQAHLASVLGENRDFLARRSFVRYAEDVSPQQIDDVLHAVTSAGGIVAWTQPMHVDWPAFWRPDNPLQSLTPGVNAFALAGNREAILVIANATPEERIAAVGITASGLGLGAEREADLYIEPMAGLNAPPPPAAPKAPSAAMDASSGTGDDPWLAAMIRGIEIESEAGSRNEVDVVLDGENYRFRDGTLEVSVKAFGLRVLRVTPTWLD